MASLNRKLSGRSQIDGYSKTDQEVITKCKNCGKQLPANQSFAHFYGCK